MAIAAGLCLLGAGPVSLAGGAAALEGNLTATWQTADDDRIKDETLASVDVTAHIAAGPGTVSVHVEGSTTPSNGRVSGLVPEANADAGSALDANGKGRLQISEVYYSLPLGQGEFTAGLLDTSGFLDTSQVANDEHSQFLGSSFVNNPTIGFPDYTPGAAYRVEAEDDRVGYAVVLTSSSGLADNAGSYSETFDVGDETKGIFTAAEFTWPLGQTHVSAGVWLNSGEHDRLNGSGTENNYGVYAVVDGILGAGRYNLRAGIANEDVSEAAGFIAAAYEHPFTGAVTGGAGIAHIEASDELGPGSGNTLQGEVYLRWDVNKHLQLSPDIQYVRNPGFDSSNTVVDNDVVVYGLRTGINF